MRKMFCRFQLTFWGAAPLVAVGFPHSPAPLVPLSVKGLRAHCWRGPPQLLRARTPHLRPVTLHLSPITYHFLDLCLEKAGYAGYAFFKIGGWMCGLWRLCGHRRHQKTLPQFRGFVVDKFLKLSIIIGDKLVVFPKTP